MANSIDFAAICLGVALGYGLRKEIRSTGEVCRNALLSGIAGAAETIAESEEKKKAGAGNGTGQAGAGQSGQGAGNGN